MDEKSSFLEIQIDRNSSLGKLIDEKSSFGNSN